MVGIGKRIQIEGSAPELRRGKIVEAAPFEWGGKVDVFGRSGFLR